MPHIISNPGSRQSQPLYRNNCNCKHHNMKNNDDGTYKTDMEKRPEKTETLPKTYDAIKNAAGASTNKLTRKWIFADLLL